MSSNTIYGLIPELSTFSANGEFISNLVIGGVRVLVIGGVAVRYYVPSRVADDLDVMIRPSAREAQAIMDDLYKWNEEPNFSLDALSNPGDLPRHLPLKKFLYLDLIVPAANFPFDAEWQRASPATLKQRAVRVAAPDLLIELKTDSAREEDVDDVRALNEYLTRCRIL